MSRGNSAEGLFPLSRMQIVCHEDSKNPPHRAMIHRGIFFGEFSRGGRSKTRAFN